MLGGCQKKMYYIKDTRSRLFTEAYFVLRNGADMHPICENDLAAEADRILRERFPAKKRRLKRPKYLCAITFVCGAIAGGAFTWFII